MASTIAIQASCQAAIIQKAYIFQTNIKRSQALIDPSSHRKFAIRPTVVRCTIVEQTTTRRNGDMPGRICEMARMHSVSRTQPFA
jgi:hypothetical protein